MKHDTKPPFQVFVSYPNYYMKIKVKNLFTVIVLIISLRFFSFQMISSWLWGAFEIILVLIFTLFFFKNKMWKQENQLFKSYVLFFAFLPWLSVIVCKITWGQSFGMSTVVTYNSLYWLFYFILHYYKLKPDYLLKLVVLFAIIWTVLEIVQQYTYPSIFFYTRGDGIIYEGKVIELRSGIYRFMITDYIIALFSFFWLWEKFILVNVRMEKRIIFLILLLIIMTGLYYNQTRSIVVSAVIPVIITLILIVKRRKYSNILLFTIIFICLIIIGYYGSFLFGDLVDKTKNKEEITRVLGYPFFAFEYWKHWINVIFGNGWANKNSQYGQDYMSTGLSRGDVGIIGILNAYGIFFILIYIHFIVYVLRKLWKRLEYYQKLFFLSLLVLLPLVTPFYNIPGSGVYKVLCSIYFYLIDIKLKDSTSSQMPITVVSPVKEC